MLQRPATVPTYSNSTSEEFRDSLNIRMSLPRASFILRVPENSQFTPILSPRVSTPISTLPRANIPAPIAVSPNLPPPPPTLVKTLKWSELNAPAWSVVSHSHNVWETFLKADAPVEASSVSKDSRRFVEANLARGIYTVDMLDAIEQQNVDIMFWEIYPKFMRAYNLDRLHRYGIL
ncbi:hypothetical protein BC829DRAFT_266005 [Chytridium lagenaria]|nr:hypothetical protein BC829DRAFT_266005 [Chytridium lagenaria]